MRNKKADYNLDNFGALVKLSNFPPYLKVRKKRGYFTANKGAVGIIIGATMILDEYAVFMFDVCWKHSKTHPRSSFDNGCHQRGPTGHCIYVPAAYIDMLGKEDLSERWNLLRKLSDFIERSPNDELEYLKAAYAKAVGKLSEDSVYRQEPVSILYGGPGMRKTFAATDQKSNRILRPDDVFPVFSDLRRLLL